MYPSAVLMDWQWHGAPHAVVYDVTDAIIHFLLQSTRWTWIPPSCAGSTLLDIYVCQAVTKPRGLGSVDLSEDTGGNRDSKQPSRTSRSCTQQTWEPELNSRTFSFILKPCSSCLLYLDFYENFDIWFGKLCQLSFL